MGLVDPWQTYVLLDQQLESKWSLLGHLKWH